MVRFQMDSRDTNPSSNLKAQWVTKDSNESRDQLDAK